MESEKPPTTLLRILSLRGPPEIKYLFGQLQLNTSWEIEGRERLL
jgi:hypothetical protein